MAAYELVSKGYKSVSVLKGGFLEWERTDRYVQGHQHDVAEPATSLQYALGVGW